jgi:hypothetical protein
MRITILLTLVALGLGCAPLLQTGGSVSALKFANTTSTNDAPQVVAMPAAQVIDAPAAERVTATSRNDPRTTTTSWKLIAVCILAGVLLAVAGYFIFTSARVAILKP